ncbi:EAL domain-containing protein [Cellulomonas hominis]|uniref:EAL domain-containing protein n=1 Tax=Cellulomonas hominis TaxID=156981 RepID=A0A7Z8K2D8_9CELL|nr:EAL domain-containing protein [Cellulomonas hominis]TKR25005.1 EAL domain-containing protein [Cellulomonas hominis]
MATARTVGTPGPAAAVPPPAGRSAVIDAEPTAPPVDDPRWRDALRHVLADPAAHALHAQPVVELATGFVAGYELLSRFDGPWRATPDVWFAAAQHWGANPALQARVLAKAVAARADLPQNTFLTVNVDPHLLADDQVAGALLRHADLSRLVLELTEHTRLDEGGRVLAALDRVRAAGALVAMDDAGTGYAGLELLLALRPDIVKLDRALITGIDADPVKRALVEVFGDLVGRMDGWILAEGVETRAELDALIALRVPLAQGWALGRPQPQMLPALPPEDVAHIRATASRASLTGNVASVVRPARAGRDRDGADVLLRDDGRVTEVRDGAGRWVPAMTVAPSASLAEVARRAVLRPEPRRWHPLVCTDVNGAVIGTVPLDALVLAVCDAPGS